MLQIKKIIQLNFCPKNSRQFYRYYESLSIPEQKKLSKISSTSTNLKEALSEKIPLYYDKIRKLRSDHGSSVIKKIKINDVYEGLSSMQITENNLKYGTMYRGVSMNKLINLLPKNHGRYPSGESVFWLLLTGDIPTETQTAALINDWTKRRLKRKKIILNECKNFLQLSSASTSPLKRLFIILTIVDGTKHQLKSRFKSPITWENTYEDCMDFLANLPVIFSLVKSPVDYKKSIRDEGDWVDCLLSYLETSCGILKNKTNSVDDFLRLFITINADKIGLPSSLINQIFGASQMDVNKILLAKFLAMSNESKTGNLISCMNFQEKITRLLGEKPKENVLRGLIRAFMEPGNLPGYRLEFSDDPRFNILQDFAKNACPSDPGVQLSLDITRVVGMIPRPDNSYFLPEPNSLAPALFKYHGLHDMEFNESLICMSRALGSIATIIWNRIIDLPPLNPSSSSTNTFIESFESKKIQ